MAPFGTKNKTLGFATLQRRVLLFVPGADKKSGVQLVVATPPAGSDTSTTGEDYPSSLYR